MFDRTGRRKAELTASDAAASPTASTAEAPNGRRPILASATARATTNPATVKLPTTIPALK